MTGSRFKWIGKKSAAYPQSCPGGAFTLIELLVVIAIIGVLASLLITGLDRALSKSRGMVCLNNTRQLTVAWLMYTDDQQGWLCPNGIGAKQGWVEGTMDFTGSSDNTNTLYLVDPAYAKLATYVRSAAVYRCPSDRSLAHVAPGTIPRVRSLAMNEAVGSNAQAPLLSASGQWQVYRKANDLTAPDPSNLWVLIEQHPDSIDDGRFAVDCASQGGEARWVDFPANFHNGSCSLSFADGHSETHRWVAEGSAPPNRYCGCLAHYADNGFYASSPNNPDLAWLQQKTSARKN
jgi:prepilin-type N-terminal cleavage/methylation domain-containing protein/prepilin-type processing-associated H-X9-DG protein